MEDPWSSTKVLQEKLQTSYINGLICNFVAKRLFGGFLLEGFPEGLAPMVTEKKAPPDFLMR